MVVPRFLPPGGSGATNAANGFINVTDPAIGMVANTGIDNYPMVATLNNAIGPLVLGPGYSGNYEAVIPGKFLGQYGPPTITSLKPFHAPRSAKYHCVAPRTGGGSVRLWFAAGVDGIIQDQGGKFENCLILNAGLSTFWGNALTNNIYSMSNYSGGLGGAPSITWHVGDGFFAPFPGYYATAAIDGHTRISSRHPRHRHPRRRGCRDIFPGATLTTTAGDPGIGALLSGGGVKANTYVIERVRQFVDRDA